MEFEKYHKIRQLGDEENEDIFAFPEDDIIIEEKIDGANFRIYLMEDGNILYGSRTQTLGGGLEEGKVWKRCIGYISERLSNADLDRIPKPCIIYGECCVKHTMTYDWDKIPPFLGFDIKTSAGYWGYNYKKTLFKILGLHMVPLVWKGKANNVPDINDDFVPTSSYAIEQAEGLVIKNYLRQVFGKYVRVAFKEKNAEAFGGSPKWASTDNSAFSLKYATNARIEKHIYKLIDSDIKLELAMMKFLPTAVWEDIWEEEWRDIVRQKWVIDFKETRKKITGRCLAVLKNIITNNALAKRK